MSSVEQLCSRGRVWMWFVPLMLARAAIKLSLEAVLEQFGGIWHRTTCWASWSQRSAHARFNLIRSFAFFKEQSGAIALFARNRTILVEEIVVVIFFALSSFTFLKLARDCLCSTPKPVMTLERFNLISLNTGAVYGSVGASEEEKQRRNHWVSFCFVDHWPDCAIKSHCGTRAGLVTGKWTGRATSSEQRAQPDRLCAWTSSGSKWS